ncbi:SGNH/GDSL hydrolase family protein [Desertivirga xinjiangensis]|uniref:SGNH/GDSL hydrolase family protein n=1 Tax=Desertivirga xinjiangensis TaxID=539206 RepID=UPI0021087D34|nr:SGNH/GDSL hydrolase family protein [Pedobacter xinjiangensis]
MKRITAYYLLAILAGWQVKAQTLSPFKKGDKVAFMGNSITEAGYYGSNIWLYYMTRFPDQRITIYNVGIGGDVVGQMNERFEFDVLPKKPNFLVLTFGMNDTGYFEFNQENAEETTKQRIQTSFQNFGLLQAKLKAQPGITPIIMSSAPYDETMRNKNNYYKGKSKAMEQIVAFQREAAQKNGWPYVDLFHPMTEINLREQKVKPEFTITGPDRIHPGRGGHLVMAATFLKSQGLAGKPVAKLDLDAKKGVISVENATVAINKKPGVSLSINYLAKALPFPIDSVSGVWENPQTQADALTVYPFIEEFNQEILKVRNLKKGRYDLVIDGQKISSFSSDTLEKGINMAVLGNTPQYRQAAEIMYLNDLRLDLEKKLREYYWLQYNYFKGQNMLFEDSQLAFEKAEEKAKADWFVKSKMGTYQTARFPEVRKMWQDNIDQLTNKIYQMNVPKMHLIEIVAVK